MVLLTALSASLSENYPHSPRAVLAVSGGADSVALLRAWAQIHPSREEHWLVATFDHGLRPESPEDATFVENLSKELGIRCVVGRSEKMITGANGRSMEGEARQARYKFLANVAREHAASVVVTAHTRNDQAETILFRLLRGTGLPGLAGIPTRRALTVDVELFRPLLDVSREQVLRFLESLGQGYREDPTNGDLRFRRNRIRHELLPYLRTEFNPRVDDALLRLAELGRESTRAEQAVAKTVLGDVRKDASKGAVLLPGSVFRELGSTTIAQVIRQLFEREGWPRRQLGMKEIRRIVSLFTREGAPSCQLPDGIRARRMNDEGDVELAFFDSSAEDASRETR